MGVRVVRLVAALALMGSGALMYAASWQRWAEACLWWEVQGSTPFCWVVQDHKYDFVVPSDPWTPIGTAAEQAGLSLLVLAAALVLTPWALTSRRPGPFSALTLLVSVASVALVGIARSSRSRVLRWLPRQPGEHSTDPQRSKEGAEESALLRAAMHARWLRCRHSTGQAPPSLLHLAIARASRRSRRADSSAPS